jgi:hypothetical protein
MQQIYTETAQIENVTFRRLRSRAGTQGMAARGADSAVPAAEAERRVGRSVSRPSRARAGTEGSAVTGPSLRWAGN